jgi:TolB-like protein
VEAAAPPEPAAPTRRASLAVMPFADDAPDGAPQRGSVADGLAFDIITRLAKLRSLFVIAPGTVFALDERRIGADEAGRRLDVDYVASGRVRRVGHAPGRLQVNVQLVQTRSARIVWADELLARGDETFGMLDEIGNRIVAAMSHQVELAERQRAILKPPATLDAWEAHHRGLWHMVRFNPADNAQARRFFEAALKMDPQFSRAWAGLSFTHFQDAFLGWGDRAQAVELAYRMAAQGLAADELDPATHWAMGRALWLRGQQGQALAALDAAVGLSPNFALAHYTRGFLHAQSGDPHEGIAACDQSRGLSPFDPLLFAMLATRALSLMRLGRHDEAADWALRATVRPNAHVHIQAIAAHCLALAGRLDEARAQVAAIHHQRPGYGVADFLAAFRFEPGAQGVLRGVAPRIAMA